MNNKNIENAIIEKVNGYDHILMINPPYDYVSEKTGQRNYHGTDLFMIVRKNNNCIQFGAFIPIYLPNTFKTLHNKDNYISFEGYGFSLDYHSEKPRYTNQKATECNLLDGGKCYHDGSSTQGRELYDIFITEGMDKVWKILEERWEITFGDTNNRRFFRTKKNN